MEKVRKVKSSFEISLNLKQTRSDIFTLSAATFYTPRAELVKSFNSVLVAYELHEVCKTLKKKNPTFYQNNQISHLLVRLQKSIMVSRRAISGVQRYTAELTQLHFSFKVRIGSSRAYIDTVSAFISCLMMSFITLQGSLFLFSITSISKLGFMQDV